MTRYLITLILSFEFKNSTCQAAADKIIITVKIIPSFPLWLQTSALVLPLTFLAAGGCGGGGDNGLIVPPPVVLGSPTPTPVAGTTPIPTATTDPNATPDPTSGGTYTPNLNFTTFVADGSLLRINDRNPTSELFIRVDGGVRAEGQTQNARGTAAGNNNSSGETGVDYIEGLGRRVWEATGGTATILRYRVGTVGPGLPGEYSVQLNNVQMAPFAGTSATGTFVLNGTYTATSGTVN